MARLLLLLLLLVPFIARAAPPTTAAALRAAPAAAAERAAAERAAVQAERARIRSALRATPEAWIRTERWVPLPAGSSAECRLATGELKAKCVNRALVVRAVVPEARDGKPGLAINQLIRVVPQQPAAADAARKHGPEEAKAKQAFQQVVKFAQDEFLRQAPLSALYQSALAGVAQAGATEKTAIFRNAMSSLAQGLNDRWTKVFDPVAAVDWKLHGKAQQVGCGVILAQDPARGVLLEKIVPRSPAATAGLLPGDRVLAVGGQPVTTREQTSALLKGERGTPITVEVERGGARQTVTVTRDLYRTAFVELRYNASGIGVVRLPQFYDGAAREVAAGIAQLERQHGAPLTGLVLDLRGNGGGSRPEWVAILNDFIKAGSLGTNQGQGGRLLESFTAKPTLAGHPDLPLAVLVDGHSASASERVAGVLKDRGRALIIGEPTYGKDVGQSTHDLADGSSFKVTNVQFHLPSGAAPGAIQPDVSSTTARAAVERAAGGRTISDPELSYAIYRLRQGVATTPAATTTTTTTTAAAAAH